MKIIFLLFIMCLTMSEKANCLGKSFSNSFKTSLYSPRPFKRLYGSPSELNKFNIAWKELEIFDPCKKQIHPFESAEKYKDKFAANKITTHMDWVKPSSVEVLYGTQTAEHSDKPLVYVGGLSMLFEALRKLETVTAIPPTKKTVIFINDGQLPIYKQSGFQLHAHGTQYPDYNALYLFKKLIQSNSRFFQKSPLDLDYDNLHLPINKNFTANLLHNT